MSFARDSVTRVLRVSLSRVNGSVMDELFAARERACGTSHVPGLHGALLHASGWFVLWLEGSAGQVDHVLARSAKHSCHTQARVIHRSEGPVTLRETLTLAATQWPESATAFARRIHAAQDVRPPLEPNEMWRRLAEPCTLGHGTARRRVALVSSDDTRCIDFVRKLGERFRTPVVYQRLATSELQTRDVGAAYVDIRLHGEPTRVQVLSRRALGHRMVRESLRDVDRLAMLLGTRPRHAMALADTVADFIDASTTSPEIDLVGECPDIAHSVGDYLRRNSRHAVPSRVVKVPASRLDEALFAPLALAA